MRRNGVQMKSAISIFLGICLLSSIAVLIAPASAAEEASTKFEQDIPIITGAIETNKTVRFNAIRGQWTTIVASGPTDEKGRPKKACTGDRQNDFKHLVVLALTYRDWQLFYQQYPLLAEQLKRLGLYREIVPKAEKPLPTAKHKKIGKGSHKRVTEKEKIQELEDRIEDIEDENDDLEE